MSDSPERTILQLAAWTKSLDELISWANGTYERALVAKVDNEDLRRMLHNLRHSSANVVAAAGTARKDAQAVHKMLPKAHESYMAVHDGKEYPFPSEAWQDVENIVEWGDLMLKRMQKVLQEVHLSMKAHVGMRDHAKATLDAFNRYVREGETV